MDHWKKSELFWSYKSWQLTQSFMFTSWWVNQGWNGCDIMETKLVLTPEFCIRSQKMILMWKLVRQSYTSVGSVVTKHRLGLQRGDCYYVHYTIVHSDASSYVMFQGNIDKIKTFLQFQIKDTWCVGSCQNIQINVISSSLTPSNVQEI